MDWESFYNNFRNPDFIPGYEIQNRLGGGAFGEVYKARKHSIGKAYAIKFLKLDDEAQRDAIERELDQVRHFAAIDHPNLVTIEDLGTVMDVPYLVMGYAGEDTLGKRLRSGRLELSEALLYFVQACRGVLALHDRRLVHFDLKPGNVFLKGDAARVGDYGLSKLMIDGRMTLSFGRGTPQYMAPEMLKNRADHRADIYSLGVVLYESLAGELPFESSSSTGLIVREKDETPNYPEDFPDAARAVVERCLRVDPDDRYASVNELLADLGQTARPGDSVITSLPRTAPQPRPSRRSGAQDRSVSTAPSAGDEGSDELRQTAAELARGAVEVARGVWDGIRDSGSGSEGSATAVEAEPVTPLPATPVDPTWARESEAVAFGREVPPRDLVVDARAPEPAVTGQAAAGVVTIPVPPRVAGGVLGTLLSTLVLGLEVLVTLVTGSLRQVLWVLSGRGGRILSSTGSFVGRVGRFVLFLALLTLLGGLVTYLLAVVIGNTI